MRVCSACGRRLEDDASFCPYDGTPLPQGRARRDPLIGLTIAGRYQIEYRLGSGGFSVVYVARHLGLGREVALKVLHESLIDSNRAVARFAREARAASRIDHENVVQVFDFGFAEQGFHYLVMELVGGSPLDVEISRSAPIPAARALHILGQIAAGVGRAHELGIVHRDLKPENVVLTQRGNDRDFVKVLDFGLARIVRLAPGEKAITQAGDVFGTPAYMAPEQWQAQPADARTDIYALGLIGYELLTGWGPFDAEQMADMMLLHVDRVPPRPNERVPDARVPEHVEAVIMKCLKKSPSDRYATVAELLAALAQVARQLPDASRYAHHTGSFVGRAPPPPDAIPDPTVYQSRQLEVVWDGPALCEEIGRLHELRARRLAELAAVIWRDGPPREVQELQRGIAQLEHQVEAHGRDVAVIRAQLEELMQSARQHEAVLRSKMISASLDLQAALERLPFEVTDPSQSLPDDSLESIPTLIRRRDGSPVRQERTPPTAPAHQAHEERLRSAERQLVSHQRRLHRDEIRVQYALTDAIARLRAAERELAPLYEKLTALVPREAARIPELRAPLVAFAKIDGALATYQAMLEAMEIVT